jgi:porin
VSRLAGLACLLATAACWPAMAQTGNSDPSQQLSWPSPQTPAQKNVAPSVEHLLGDWGGVRTNLENQGIFLTLDALTEFAGNVSGGVKQGATFASQVGFGADIDWQRLAGIMGLSTHVIIVNRSGSSDSALFGDNFMPVQEIYGSGGNVAMHLVSAYAEEAMFEGSLDIAAGRMNVENDFASSPLYCNYMNNGLCGDPKALPGGDIGHSAYPDAAWAARVRVRPTPDTYVQTGVYEVNQGLYSDENFRSGFKFDDSQDSGVYVPVEVAYEPLLGSAKMPGHYKIGFGYDSSSTYKDFSSALNAASNTTSGVPVPTHAGNTQTWILVDQMLLRQGPGDQDGIVALGGFVHNDPNNSPYAEQYFAGALDHGFWRARPQDTAALLFTYNTVSGVLGKVQALESEFGIPFSNAATGVQTHEMIFEVNYDIHAARGVNFQPDFQYVFRPNAQVNIHNATVFGFRAHVVF